MKYIIIIIITLTISCTKEKVIPPIDKLSINELALKFDNNIQTKTKLRLAFGKAVANAMGNVDFRNYIKSRSKAGGHVYFDEIVFALHKDDVLCGSSLKEVIADAADDEIKDLFGDDFIDMVLLNDPLVSIKIPDIFLNLNWDTENILPMVYIQTPKHFTFNNIQVYNSYHSSGYQEMVDINKKPDYFCVVVKYSEDYFLWDLELNENENAVSIFDLFPQFERCWDDIRAKLTELGTESDFNNLNYYQIKGLKNIHDEFCLSSKDYNFILDDESCVEECKRDCRPLNETITFLDTIVFQQRLMYSSFAKGSDLIYTDNISLKLLLKSDESSFVYFFGLKYSEVFNPSFDFNLELKKVKIEGIGKTTLPEIDLPIQLPDKFIIVQADLQINDNFIFTHPNTQLKMELFFVNYSDIITENNVQIFGSGSYSLFSSRFVNFENTRWYYCATNSDWKYLAAFSCNIKY